MWDEASQKARALLIEGMAAKNITESQNIVEVMVVLGAVYEADVEVRDGETVCAISWQPWVTAPLLLESTKASFLLEGLKRSMPIDMRDRASLEKWAAGVELAVISRAFDSASSNVSAYSCMVYHVETSPISTILFHGQRCLSHQINIIRAASVTMAGFAGMLYSLSKLLGNGSAITGLHRAIVEHVKRRLVVRRGVAPPSDDMYKVLLDIFGLGGDQSLIVLEKPKGVRSRGTVFCNELRELCRRCHFDFRSGAWIYYVEDVADHRRPQRELEEKGLSHIVGPIVKVLLGRRWEVAALSRWTGVSSCVKRATLGAVLNNVLPECLANLSRQLSLSDEKLQQAKQKLAEAILRGEEAENHWLQNATRVMKVSKFFQDGARRWQMGVLLIAGSVVERLHWCLLGKADLFRKATLSDLVDPRCSVLARSSSDLRVLLQEWTVGGRWRLLSFLGLQSPESRQAQDVMVFARSLLFQIASGLFHRLELKHSGWPYMLQVLISPSASAADRLLVAEALEAAQPCCLGPFGRRFRHNFPSCADVLGPRAKATLLLWERGLKFTTAPAECEHKAMKEELASSTSGSSHGPICWRAVCRHVHKAHVQRGGPDCSLQLRRPPISNHRILGNDVQGYLPIQPGLPDAVRPQELQAVMDGHAGEADAQGDGELPGDGFHAPALGAVGGGNPKIMFMNLKVRDLKLRKHVGQLSLGELSVARRDACAEFDRRPELQRRWTALFAARLRQRQEEQRQEAGLPSQVVARHEPVWEHSMQVDGQPRGTPVAGQLVKQLKDQIAPKDVQRLSSTATEFTITAESATPDLASAKDLWGCGNEWHNVCSRHIFSKGPGKLAVFRQLQTCLNKWVDTLDRKVVKQAVVLAHLWSAPDESAPVLHTWVLLTSAMFSPKVQLYARCGPVDEAFKVDESGFSTQPPDHFPSKFAILLGPSRFWRFCAEPGPSSCIFFETGDELVERLLCRSGWMLAPVEYRIDETAESLLNMVVTSEGDHVRLEPSARSRPAASEDALLAFLALPAGDAVAHGLAQARCNDGPGLPESSDSKSFGDEADDVEAAEGMDDIEAMLCDVLEREFGWDLGDFGEVEAVAAELDGEPLDDDALDDSFALGVAPLDVEPSTEAGAEEGAEEAPDAVNAEFVDVVVAASEFLSSPADGEAPCGPAAASSSSSSSSGGAPAEELPDGISISLLGYVKCSRVGFDPDRVIGYVSTKADGSSIFANCHLHAACSVSAGIKRFDVSRAYMASWLAMGENTDRDLPRAQRLEAGVRHRTFWKRPF